MVIEGGLCEDHVNDAVRIAATLHAAAVALEIGKTWRERIATRVSRSGAESPIAARVLPANRGTPVAFATLRRWGMRVLLRVGSARLQLGLY